MRVIHFPTSVGGMSWELAQGEKKLGLDSEVFYLDNTWLNYPCDFHRVKDETKYQFFEKIKWAYSFSKRYDVFHLNYGSSIIDYPEYGLDYLDLILYKGKKICVTYNGCDARQKYIRMKQDEFAPCNFPNCYGGVCQDGSKDRIKARRIKKLESLGVIMFALNPDLMNFLPESACFLPYAINEGVICKKENYEIQKVIKVIHAPTQRVVKGTEEVIATINKINKVYKDVIDFKLIEGVEHRKAIKMYKEADLVIDQLRVGWYGALATESMCMGIPTIAYINKHDLKYIPKQMAEDCINTVIDANQNTLFEVLENIVNNPSVLYEKHKASMEYVYRWHRAEYVASITKKEYER